MHMGHNPNIVLADYLSFMFDPQTEYIGVTYFYRSSTSVQFSEEELNTSMKFVYLPATAFFEKSGPQSPALPDDRIIIRMYISDDETVAYHRAKELVDMDKPVIAAVDLYNISYHQAYQKNHGLHCVVIHGYDEEKKSFEIIDKFRLANCDFDGVLPMSEVNTARMAHIPLSNPMIGEQTRSIRNLWMEISAGAGFEVSDAKLLEILSESCRRMRGRSMVLGQPCGLERLDLFRNCLLQKKDQEMDERTLFYYKTYLNMNFKNIARSRNRFKVYINELEHLMPVELRSQITDCLTESAKRWDIAANLALKMAIIKLLKLAEDLDKQLEAVKEQETRVIESLEGFLERGRI
jgi:hypothetical protein